MTEGVFILHTRFCGVRVDLAQAGPDMIHQAPRDPISGSAVVVRLRVSEVDHRPGDWRHRRVEHIEALESKRFIALDDFGQMQDDCASQRVARAVGGVSRVHLTDPGIVGDGLHVPPRAIAQKDAEVVVPVARESEGVHRPVCAARGGKKTLLFMVYEAAHVDAGVLHLQARQHVPLLGVVRARLLQRCLDPSLACFLVGLLLPRRSRSRAATS
mmetsp:Transcript_108150/g.304593  ORF Transcript_108150/g.304593 Transcript_108150/m.304593 type:complete len:214 (+) Transcript_108150:472-1113(+)